MVSLFIRVLVLLELINITVLKGTRAKLENTKKRANVSSRASLSAVTVNTLLIANKAALAVSRTRLFLLRIKVVVVTFLELIPVFLKLLFSLLLILCIVVVIVSVIMVGTFLRDTVDRVVDGFVIPSNLGVEASPAVVQWSESELALRGLLLTNREKNWYRLIMLYNRHLENTSLTYGEDNSIALRFAVGLASTESGGEFFIRDADSRNILTNITDKTDITATGHSGVFGLRSTRVLSDYFPQSFVDVLRARYTPDRVSVNPTTDVLFIPWASAMSLRHLRFKIDEQTITRVSTFEIADRLMDSFGIVANRDYLMDFLIWNLATAQYHGASSSEWESYMAFVCAVFAATSENDELRSFSRWGIVANNFSESTMRQLILGSTPMQRIDHFPNASLLPRSTTSAYLTLNGVRLEKPLWAFLYSRYGTMPEMRNAWALARTFAQATDNTDIGHGMVARVLNFHYGLNSYLQGSRVINKITSKLTGGVFRGTAGVGQGIWDGLSIEDYLARSESALKDRALRLRPYWGTARYMSAKTIGRVRWEPDKWGVPFFRQGGGTESFGRVLWGARGSTFDRDGCMLYSYAYVASALTGRLINPPEIASIMYVNGALIDGGVVLSRIGSVFEKLGLTYENVRMSSDQGVQSTEHNFNLVWGRIDATLEQGGLAVVMGGAPWADGVNHFFVVTDKRTVDGRTKYRVYTSSNVTQTMTWWDRSAFVTTLHSVVGLVTR